MRHSRSGNVTTNVSTTSVIGQRSAAHSEGISHTIAAPAIATAGICQSTSRAVSATSLGTIVRSSSRRPAAAAISRGTRATMPRSSNAR
jgi:hypothetical protein